MSACKYLWNLFVAYNLRKFLFVLLLCLRVIVIVSVSAKCSQNAKAYKNDNEINKNARLTMSILSSLNCYVVCL